MGKRILPWAKIIVGMTIGFLLAQAIVDGVKSWRGQVTIILDKCALEATSQNGDCE